MVLLNTFNRCAVLPEQASQHTTETAFLFIASDYHIRYVIQHASITIGID